MHYLCSTGNLWLHLEDGQIVSSCRGVLVLSTCCLWSLLCLSNLLLLPKEKKKGRKVCRAEVYKVAYTRKDGRPQPARQQTLAQIDEKYTDEPDFVDKPIGEGDFLSRLIGKENRGGVTGIGMGPTPASLGMPGTKPSAARRLQLEREGRLRADNENQALKEAMQNIEERMEEHIEQRIAERFAKLEATRNPSQSKNGSIPVEEQTHRLQITYNCNQELHPYQNITRVH